MKKKSKAGHRVRAAQIRSRLVYVAGECLQGYSPDYIMDVVRTEFEWSLVTENKRVFDSIRVPRSLRKLWNDRKRMTRNADGYVTEGEWPECQYIADWDIGHNVYDAVSPESRFACALIEGVLNLVNG